MKISILVLLVVMVVPAVGYCDILFWDDFSSDTLGDYTFECYEPATDSAGWQIVDSVLRGESLSSGPCYAETLGHPTWDIVMVDLRMRSDAGQARGVSIHSASGEISLTLRGSPDNDIVLQTGIGPGYVNTVPLGYADGTWLRLFIHITSSEIGLNVGLDNVLQASLDPALATEPFTALRLWVADSSTANFDNIIIFGAGISPVKGVSWGGLKSIYR